MWNTHLLETDGSRLLAEALTAEVKAVLADETSLVGAEAAAERTQAGQRTSFTSVLPTHPPPLTPSFTLNLLTSSNNYPAMFEEGYSPLTAALAVLAGAREPNGVVGHFGWS